MSFFAETFGAARREPAAGTPFGWLVAAVTTGLLIPCLIVTVGLIASLLERHGLTESPVRLGNYLSVPVPGALIERPPLVQLGWLTGVAFVLTALFGLTSWLHRSGSERRSRAVATRLHRELLRQSLRRAEIEGAISQRQRALELIEQRLPQLARGLVAWWQAIPRSVLLVAGSVVVALTIDIPLASLAVIGGLLLWQFYQSLKARQEDETTTWELPRSRRRLVDLVNQAPLLAKTHTGGVADQAFAAELDALMHQVAAGQASHRRLMPLMAIAIALVVSLLVLGLGVNLLAESSHLSLASALVLGLSLAGAVAGATRLNQAAAGMTVADEAARAVYQFLEVRDDAPPSEQRVGLAGVRDSVVLQDVELRSADDESILSGISLALQPGELVALMGTKPISPLALAELLLGIGRPNRGRISFDGIDLKDIHPRSLAKNVLWIGADGPIHEGTLAENLLGERATTDSGDVITLTQSLGIDNLLTRLEDGLQTVLTADDSRLTAEEKYAIGIARAMLHKPAIIVVQEPPPPDEELGGDRAMVALRKLADERSLIIVLPRRLPTLRSTDRVVLLNGSKLAGEGKHNELLHSSDLYRHLNYLLFNPYRGAI